MQTYLKDCRWGRFLLLRGDMISTYADVYGEWSELEVSLYRRILKPDSVVIEVGANLGLHTVPLAKIVASGQVICFEPQRLIFHVLSGNLALNDLSNVHAHRLAVGEHGEPSPSNPPTTTRPGTTVRSPSRPASVARAAFLAS
jgi:hypothetical protein